MECRKREGHGGGEDRERAEGVGGAEHQREGEDGPDTERPERLATQREAGAAAQTPHGRPETGDEEEEVESGLTAGAEQDVGGSTERETSRQDGANGELGGAFLFFVGGIGWW
jgi:hypothetical protein